MLKKISALLVFLAMIFCSIKPASAEVLNWEKMVGDDLTGNRAAGFGDNNNLFTNSMVIFNDYVYVSNYTQTTGTEVWRSSNGTDWEQANTDNFGDGDCPISYATLAVFNDNLYAFNYLIGQDHVHIYRTSNGTTWASVATIGDVNNPITSPMVAAVYDNSLYVGVDNDVLSVVYSSSNGTAWTASNANGFGNPNNVLIQAMATFNNRLYVGTYNAASGTEVWYYNGVVWAQDNTDGFDGSTNYSIGSLTSFGGAFYASTINDEGSEVWKTTGGVDDWTKVVGADNGFGQGNDTAITYNSAVFKDKLYIGASAGASKAKVFSSSDGATYEQVNDDGFGSDNILVAFAVLGDYLYAGTGTLPGRQVNTTEVYRYYEATPVPTPEVVVEVLPQTGIGN